MGLHKSYPDVSSLTFNKKGFTFWRQYQYLFSKAR